MHHKINFLSDHNEVEALPSPEELMREYPVRANIQRRIQQFREKARNIIQGRDERMLLIVGPCSIHNSLSAKEYAGKLLKLSEEVKDAFFLVMRVHLEKPRTTVGWKGFLYDPFLDGSSRIEVGLNHSRRLLIELAEMGVPCATEFLDPIMPYYLGDLVTWGQIGARTSSSQIHRQMASALPMPIGIKNTVDGNVQIAAEGIVAARSPQSFLGISREGRPATIRTQGNPDCHVVLRGGGPKGSNYDEDSILEAFECLQRYRVNPRVIVDCSHDNCERDHRLQEEVFATVLEQVLLGNRQVKGLIMESHLSEGKQAHGEHPDSIDPSISLTDPCIDWQTTEELIREGSQALAHMRESRLSICQG